MLYSSGFKFFPERIYLGVPIKIGTRMSENTASARDLRINE
jgi:hypothetical protein